MIMPFPGGSAVDLVARQVAQKMSESLGQPVIVENRPGANGMIGTDIVAKAAPDGYTLQIATPSTHVTSIFLSKNVPSTRSRTSRRSPPRSSRRPAWP